MIENKLIDKHLSRTFCYRCGASLEGAEFIPISEVPIALVGHVICPKCQAESMVTITVAGSGVMPIISDLMGNEIKKFLSLESVTYNELLDLHKMLQGQSICKLLQKQEKNSVKKQKLLEKVARSQQ